jgi:predicted RNA-binding protein with PUA-like domain
MAATRRRYWLMKSEPGCFSFADLQRRPGKTEHWDGVRNFQARNLLRDELREGDGVLFYHSNTAQPAIVGLARVVRSGYPDFTACDPRSDHFDPRACEANPIWYMVDVQALEPLPRPLSRDDLRRHPLLAGMAVLRKGNWLSVQLVTVEEWRTILELAGLADPLARL